VACDADVRCVVLRMVTEEMRAAAKKQLRSRQQSPSPHSFPDAHRQTEPQHGKTSSASSDRNTTSPWEEAVGFCGGWVRVTIIITSSGSGSSSNSI
jgi:hypothetical protein